MEIIEIIKEAFEFPSKNIGTFSIYVVLTVLAGSFATRGIISCIMGLKNPIEMFMGLLSLIIALLIGLILSGYQINVIKSGIKHDKEVPEFEWKENIMTGAYNYVVTFVYIMIPSIIVLILGYLTNVHGTFITVIEEINTQINNVYMGQSLIYAFNAISKTIDKVPSSLAVPIISALVIFIIFTFLHTMAEGRLAKTGDIREALNVLEAAKDITRIGIVKVILLIISLFVSVIVIEIIISFIFNILPFLSVLSIIISPYLLFFTQRAIGLLYSDIT